MRSIVLSTGEFPSSLILRGIDRLSSYPILGGGFADIWKGTYKGQEVAIKILRTFKRDTVCLKKVGLMQSDWHLCVSDSATKLVF